MSNIFTRNLLKDLLNEETSENNYSLPQFINIIDKKYDNNFTSSYMPQVGGNDLKHGTSNSTEDDVNQLISMLTSESDDSMKFSANSTQTEVLENRLKNMTFNGGGVKKIKQKGGADPQKIKEACKLLEDAGYTFSIKNQNCEQYLEKNSPSEIMKDFNLNNIFTKPTASPKNSKESNPSTSSFKPGTIYDTETSTVKKNINSSATSSINQSKQIKDLSDTSDVKPTTTNNSLSLPPVSPNKIETETKSANSTSSFLPPVSASKITTTSQSDTKSVNSTSSFLPVGSVSKMSSTSLNSATSIPNASETENRTLLDSAVDMVKDVTKRISRAFVGDSDTSQSNVSVTSSQNKIVNSVLPSPTSSEKPTQTGGAKKGKKKMSKKASKKTSNKKKNSTKKGKKMSGGSKKISKSTKKISKSTKKMSKSTKKMSKGSKKKVSKKVSSKKGKKMSGGAKKRGTKKTSTKKSKKSSKKSKKINKTRNTK